VPRPFKRPLSTLSRQSAFDPLRTLAKVLMHPLMRYIGCVLGLTIGACTPASADPKTVAEQCVRSQVPDGSKVSAESARQVVGNCQKAVREWLDASMRNACRGACDYSDPTVASERRDRKRVMEERLMMSVSDEVQPRFPRM
jgi:hypothetical protein